MSSADDDRDRAVEVLQELRDVDPAKRSIRVDWQDVGRWENDAERSTEYSLEDVFGIASDVVARPESVLETFEDAFEAVGGLLLERPLAGITPRFYNLPEESTFSVGSFSPARQRQHLVELEGQVTKRTEVHPAIVEAAFRCTGCGATESVEQPPFGKIREPREPCWDCYGEQREARWRLDRDQSIWRDHQKLRLQQPPEEALGETKNIDAHVFGDLAGRPEVESGKRVLLTGRLQEVYTGKVVWGKRVVGNAVTPDEEVFDDEDLAEYSDAIADLREDPDRFAKLVESVAPEHEGDPLVKEALTVQLFTGGKLYGPGGSEHRGDSHVKLIGDPGTNKTGLLKALYHRTPIAAFVDGPGSSGVGLTAAITKDDFSDEQFSIEAGALVKASGGTALVDEIDKFDGGELEALHTPLESQEVLVSKAGKRATLPAETAVVAAANPTGGHYDPRREFADQVDVQSPLLSRFDLIFVMREKVDEERVRSVASMILESFDEAAQYERGELDEDAIAAAAPPVTADEFRAYVAATQRLTPTFASDAVKEAIVDWYTELKTDLPNRYRQAVREEDRTGEYPKDAPPLPVTARKVDAMRRLAAGSARIRFSDTIEMQDVERVRPYIKRSLADIGIAPADNEAFDAVDPGVGIEEVGIGS